MNGKIQAIVIMTLVDGVLNLLLGMALIGGLATSVVGVLCLPLAAAPLALGVFEIIYAAQAFSGGTIAARPIQWLAILQVCNLLFGNVVSLIVGILALVFYNDADVKAHYDRR